MTKVSTLRALVAATLVASGVACTVHQTETPPLTGPSDLSLRIDVTATPDSINQDGASQSSIRMTAAGASGQPLSGVSLRVDTAVGGVPQDFGTLSARNVVTGSDGAARVVFTAPPSTPGATIGSCQGVVGTCVTIVATPTGNNFTGSFAQSVTIRLVPPGVILPPGETPTAIFQFSPASPSQSESITFDATASCGGTVSASGACQSTSAITTFIWNFGDGSTGSGAVVTHRYGLISPFTVTLTVTNDRGKAASTTKAVTVTAATAPKADFEFFPAIPKVGQGGVFNDKSSAGSGRTLQRFDWQFNDPTAGAVNTASGRLAVHTYNSVGTFTVVLTVTDDLGQQNSFIKEITVTP